MSLLDNPVQGKFEKPLVIEAHQDVYAANVSWVGWNCVSNGHRLNLKDEALGRSPRAAIVHLEKSTHAGRISIVSSRIKEVRSPCGSIVKAETRLERDRPKTTNTDRGCLLSY